MPKPFVFFDLGQTLVDEWEFIRYFDEKFLEILNGFGARIDRRNYVSVRDSVIRDRRIGYGSVRELVFEVCKLLAPPGYESVILRRIEPEIAKGRSEFFRFSGDARGMLEALTEMEIGIGVIANQSADISQVLEKSGLDEFFKVKVISTLVHLAKPDKRIFQLAVNKSGRSTSECVMVGDRLDTDICPAKTLGMTTIRYTNSLFSIQNPVKDCEYPTYVADRLAEIPTILERIIFE